MPPSSKRMFIGVSVAVLLVALIGLAVTAFVDVDHFKPQILAAASRTLGVEVRADGRLGMGFVPGFHITAENLHVVGSQGLEIASASRADLGVELMPLLHGQFRLTWVRLAHPTLVIARDASGRAHGGRTDDADALLAALDGARVSLTDATIVYTNRSSGIRVEATHCDLDVSRLRLASPPRAHPLTGLSIRATLACGEIRTQEFVLSAIKASVDGKDGVFEFAPVSLRVFDGAGAGSVRADLSGAVPRCEFRCTLAQFRIEEFLRTLSPKKAVEGAMDFSATLAMQGPTLNQMVRSTAGEASLRGENLVLIGNDLDGHLARYGSSQKFNLVDVGAVFFAGPVGLAVTKGYNFASLFEGSGGSTEIRTLVSDWRVERGVAHAKDVAMATRRNRIALQGGLDFANQRFDGMTVAAVDGGGCARLRQEIRGPFSRPTVEKPHALTSAAGPVLALYTLTRRILPHGPCEVFYAGSVAAPK